MVPRINSLHAPNRKQIHCCQGMSAHQLPPEGGGHEGQVPDHHQRISPSIPMPLCSPTCLQILKSVHLPFFKSRTTIFLTLCSLYSFWFLGDPQSPGCYWRFPYFHNFNPLVSPYRSPLAPPPFTCWGLVMSSMTKTATSQLGSWKGEAKSWGSISVFLGWLGHLRSCWGAGHHPTIKNIQTG